MSSATNQRHPLSNEAGSNAGATLKNLKAHAQVNFPLIVWNVEQTFVNPSEEFVELIYTFPTAYGSMLQNISVVLGERQLAGVVVPADDADDSYSDAIADGNSAILIEKNEFGLFTMNIGNLGPGETCLIRFESAALSDVVDGQAKIIFPTVIDSRYGNATTQGGLGVHATPQSSWLVEYPLELSVTLNGAARQFDVSSATHRIKVTQGSSLTVSLGETSFLDRDFELTLGNISPSYPGLVFQDPFSDIPQFLSLSPFVWQQPAEEDRVLKPSILNILVDCSGSMNGHRIEQAKKALHSILASLQPEQKFTLSRFGNDCQHFYKRPVKVGSASMKSAFAWIESLQADMGGTELIDAIEKVSDLGDSKEAEHSDLFLITDGEIWDGQEFIDTLNENRIRLFVVAIGSSSNSNMLISAAQATAGHAEVPHSDLHIEQAALRLHKRIGSARATISSMKVDGKPCAWHERNKPIFMDQAIHVFSMHDSAATNSTLNVRLENNRKQSRLELSACLEQVHELALCQTLSRLCIAQVLNAIDPGLEAQENKVARIRIIDQPELEESELEELAVRYQLLTARTKYLLVDERESKAGDLPASVNVPQMQTYREPVTMMRTSDIMFSRSASLRVLDELTSFSIPSVVRTQCRDTDIEPASAPHGAMEYTASWIEILVAKSSFQPDLRQEFDDCAYPRPEGLSLTGQMLSDSIMTDLAAQGVSEYLLQWAKYQSANDAELQLAIEAILRLLNMRANREFISHTLFPHGSMERRLSQVLGFIR